MKHALSLAMFFTLCMTAAAQESMGLNLTRGANGTLAVELTGSREAAIVMVRAFGMQQGEEVKTVYVARIMNQKLQMDVQMLIPETGFEIRGYVMAMDGHSDKSMKDHRGELWELMEGAPLLPSKDKHTWEGTLRWNPKDQFTFVHVNKEGVKRLWRFVPPAPPKEEQPKPELQPKKEG